MFLWIKCALIGSHDWKTILVEVHHRKAIIRCNRCGKARYINV